MTVIRLQIGIFNYDEVFLFFFSHFTDCVFSSSSCSVML